MIIDIAIDLTVQDIRWLIEDDDILVITEMIIFHLKWRAALRRWGSIVGNHVIIG